MWSPGTHSTHLNGPVPLGADVIESCVAVFEYIWIVVRSETRAGHGAVRLKRTFSGSTTSVDLIDEMMEAFGEAVAGSWIRSIENLTSSAVKSSPLWNFTPDW